MFILAISEKIKETRLKSKFKIKTKIKIFKEV